MDCHFIKDFVCSEVCGAKSKSHFTVFSIAPLSIAQTTSCTTAPATAISQRFTAEDVMAGHIAGLIVETVLTTAAEVVAATLDTVETEGKRKNS